MDDGQSRRMLSTALVYSGSLVKILERKKFTGGKESPKADK